MSSIAKSCCRRARPNVSRIAKRLWNEVEAIEVRKDAQLAREVEFAIPREMTQAQGIELARDFVGQEFVERGMIADLNVHWDIGADGLAKPHAHIMLTMREVGEDGLARRCATGTRQAESSNGARVGPIMSTSASPNLISMPASIIAVLKRRGLRSNRRTRSALPHRAWDERGLEVERVEDHRAVAQRNGERIIAEPRVALDAITHSQATFANRDLAMFVHRNQ